MDRLSTQLFPILVTLFILLLPVAFIGLVVFLLLRARRRAEERRQALQMVAGQMGWSFAPTGDFSMFPNLGHYSLFTEGRSKKLYNMLYGELDGGRAAVFDYAFTTGHGKHSRRHVQTIAYFQSNHLRLPYFSLGPENVLHKFISALGYQDIDFGQRPAFSSQYLLRGHDEQAIRRVFADRLLSFYETNQRLSTDAGGDQIFLYQREVTVEPEFIGQFIELGRGLANMYRSPW